MTSELKPADRRQALSRLADEVREASTASLVGEDELKWKTSTGFHVTRILAGHVAAALPRELSHGVARLRGNYDAAVATPPRRRRPTRRARRGRSLPTDTE